MDRAAREEGVSLDFQPMSPDEMQRMMQFLLNQQAAFDANFAKSQQRFDAGMEKLSAKTDRIADGLIGLTGIVGQLASAQQRTDELLKETAAQLKETDTRLNLVIQMVDRHLREDHGQRPS